MLLYALMGVMLLVLLFLLLMVVGVAAKQHTLNHKLERLDSRVSVIEIDRELNGETDDTVQAMVAMTKLPIKVRES